MFHRRRATSRSPVAASYAGYTVALHDVEADVRNDGDGWKVLAAVDWTFGAP